MNNALAIVRMTLYKDILRELRSKEILMASFLFNVIMLSTFHFAGEASRIPQNQVPLLALWTCLIFSSSLGLNRIHASETRHGCLRAIVMSPVEPGWIYVGKVCSSALLLGINILFMIPVVILFFNFNMGPNWLTFIVLLLLGTLSFVTIGTLVVAISSTTRMADIFFPILQIPLLIPVIIGGTQACQLVLDGKPGGQWIQLLIAINVVYLSVGFMLYEYLLEE